ncbi:WD40/YVTN/BNR-like repeat-containing protein, partial [Hymenobacter agri]
AGLESASWVERGPSNVGGRVLAMIFDPADATGNTLLAGTANGGLWKISNATNASTYTWTNVSSGFNNLAVSALAADASTTPATFYAGTGEGFYNADAVRGAGIFKSTDGGATWAVLPATASSPDFRQCQKLVVHPVTHDVYAATRTGGVYRSKDQGATWTQVLNTTTTAGPSLSTRAADIEIAADNTLFVSMGLLQSDGIYRSATGDAGSWTNLNTLAGSGLPAPSGAAYHRIELACAPSDANRLFAIFQDANTYGLLNIYRSLDKGNTWTAMSKPGGASFDYTSGQAWYALAAAVSPTDPEVLYVGGLDIYATGNASAATSTWTKKSVWSNAVTATNYVHADHHVFLFLPGSGTQAISGSDGGLAYTSTATPAASTTTFSQRNTNFNVTQFYAVAMHPTNNDYFLAGAQDNGTRQFTTAGINSTPQVTGGDGGYCAIDQDAPANQITSYVYNQYYRTTNSFSTAATSFALNANTGQFINAWDYDSNLNVLYAGNTTDTYLAWLNPLTANSLNNAKNNTIQPALPTGSGDVVFVGIAPLTGKRIYLGTDASANGNDGGAAFVVDNANTTSPTVTKIFPGTVNTAVSCVAVDPANEAHLLVTLSNYGVVSVYETTNANAATPTWTAVEGNLPDMPVRWALFDPRGTSRALLATEMGVYSTDKLNGASTVWRPTTNGPLNVRVDMLRYRPG